MKRINQWLINDLANEFCLNWPSTVINAWNDWLYKYFLNDWSILSNSSDTEYNRERKMTKLNWINKGYGRRQGAGFSTFLRFCNAGNHIVRLFWQFGRTWWAPKWYHIRNMAWIFQEVDVASFVSTDLLTYDCRTHRESRQHLVARGCSLCWQLVHLPRVSVSDERHRIRHVVQLQSQQVATH